MMQDNDKIIIVQAITNKLKVDLAMFLFKAILVEMFCLKMFFKKNHLWSVFLKSIKSNFSKF